MIGGVVPELRLGEDDQLSVAVGLAESLELDTVLIANHSGDHAIYPDCRPEFIDAFSSAAEHGTYNGVKVVSPYCESVQLSYPDLSDLAEEIDMQDGDVAVVCGADTLQIASSAAFGAITKLLSKTVDSEK